MRNLEEEYKKSQQEKTPDLWEKIEAGLPEKRKSQGRKRLIRYMGVAAAALFICVLIPVIRNQKRGNTMNESSSYDSAMPTNEADNNVALLPEENNEALPDSAAQEADSVLEQTDSDRSDFDSASESSIMQDAASIENAESSIVRETLEVSGSTQQGERTVYTLGSADGQTYSAVFKEGVEQKLQTGASYAFILNRVEGEEWEYEIQAVE